MIVYYSIHSASVALVACASRAARAPRTLLTHARTYADARRLPVLV